MTFGPLQVQDYFFQQGAQQFLAIAVRGSRCRPHLTNIGAESLNCLQLFGTDRAGTLLLATAEFHLGGSQIAQTILPFGFQPASDQPIFRLHCPITAFGPLRFIASTFYFQAPLRQSCIVVGLKLLHGQPSRFDRCRCDGLQKGVGYGLLDQHSADVETVLPTSIHDILAGAVIAGSRVPAAIMNMQAAATVSASDEALQQCRPLSHRASRLMRLRPRVGVEPCLIGLKRSPIDEAGVMVRNEDGPLLHRKVPNPFSDGAVFIDVAFILGLAVGVSASIHRVGEDVVKCGVSRDDPTDRTR